MKEQHKKESPILSLLGMGGGGTGNALGGVSLGSKIYDFGNVISGLSKAGAGVVATVADVNQSNTSAASWNSITDGQTGNEFARHITWYKGSTFDFGGIALTSGHGNTSDPLGAKDVAIYTSTDTTNGTDGNWTIQTPKWIRKSYAAKDSTASTYLANRTSAVSSNHWILGANLQLGGAGSAGNNALVYNRTGGAPIHDRIYFDAVTGVKGVRLDIRGKWYNGHYNNEKPHIATGYLFAPNNYAGDALESDSKTTCYIDPGLSSDNVNFTDQSGNGYNFATNNGSNRGTVSYNSGNGGHIRTSNGSVRNGANVGRGGSGSFSYGCWLKINGGSSNGGGGVIWYGDIQTDQHVFVRNSIQVNGTMAIGADIQGTDSWTTQFTKDERVNTYFTSTVGISNWFFLVLRYHEDGLIETSWDGRPFDLQFTTDRARASSLTYPFGVGGDPYNDNDSSHYFGPFFFYTGIIPYGKVLAEWDRYKTRFGRSGDPDYTSAFAGNT